MKKNNMKQEINIGVIGLGVGERHIVGYKQIENVNVIAACDISGKKLNDVCDRQEIEQRHDDYHKLLENPKIDAISICSYDNFHADQIIDAFNAGKHVMCEKPITLNKPDLERVVRAWQDSGKRISSNLILRQSPRFIELRRMVQAGEFGDIFYMEGDYIHQILWKITEGWRGDMDFYCITYGGGIHLIDLMRWIIGEDVTEVSGMAAKKITKDSSYKYPDIMTNLLRFQSDAMAKTTTCFAPQRQQIHTLNMYGTKLSFENANGDGRIYSGDNPNDETAFKIPYPAIEKGDLLPDFIDAIRNDREPNVKAKDVFRVMDICFACWQSVKEKRNIDIGYVY